MSDQLKDMLPKAGEFETNYYVVKPIYDVANNKIHYQSDPFLDEDGVIKVKRLASFDVVVETINQIVTEYTVTTEV